MQVPIHTIFLFPALDRKLIELLRSLSPDEWNKPTRAKLWTVKDVATHLLDGNFRTLSMSRDGYFGEKTEGVASYADLVHLLNRLNADWVRATKRLSPQVLIELLETTGQFYYAHLKNLEPFANAIFSVGWAGEETSQNWFHIAREYTEKWHHQQQIREAVQQPGIMGRDLYHPVLETFMRAVPYTYRDVEAPVETRIKISITGEAGGAWGLKKSESGWIITAAQDIANACEITIAQDVAWKLFTKGLSPEESNRVVGIEGDRLLGEPMLGMVAVMA
jgi:uncharacterized protein (TIGR03083 family)